jgi:hypothetical protein
MVVRRVVVCRRGVGEAVAATIAFALLSIALAYVILNAVPLLSNAPSTATGAVLGGVEQLVVIMRKDTVLEVLNVGSAPARVEGVVVVNSSGDIVVMSIASSGICTSTPSGVAVPGSSIFVVCNSTGVVGYKPVGVVTEGGRVFAISSRIEAYAEKATGIPIIVLYGGAKVSSTSTLAELLYDKSMLYSNAINTTMPMTLSIDRSSTSVSARVNASLVIVGLNPISNKLNLLVIGFGASGNYVYDGRTNVSLARAGALRYRLKVEGFAGTLQINNADASPGIYPCYINTGKQCRVTMTGTADAIKLYTNTTSTAPQAIGLDPYLFVGDIDADGNTETIFITQDFTVGRSSTFNDINPQFGQRLALDSSLKPVRLVVGTVRGSQYSTAVLSIRFFYWDSSQDDVRDNDNRVIMRAGLVDPATGDVRYSVSLSYYELCRYRNVVPFQVSYIAKDFLVYIPNEDKEFQLFVELVDPYSNTGYRNDADILLGLSYVGMTLTSR